MLRIRNGMALLLMTALVLVVVASFNGAPALAQPNAQATNTPAAAATPAPVSGDRVFVTLLPSASGPVRLILLTLKTDGKVELTTDPIDNDPATTQVGTWQGAGDKVTVNVTRDGTRTLDKPITVILKSDGENLVATEYDKSIFGDNAFTLYQRDTVEAKIAALHRAFVSLDLNAGFPLDPFLVSVNGGGELDASMLGGKCHGFINGSPTMTVNWTGKADRVRVFTYSDSDPVLVIQSPDGKFACADDTSTLALDSQIEITNPPAGKYNIWVGSAAPKQLLPTILVLTTKSDVNLSTFQLGSLVKRPTQPTNEQRYALQAKVVTEAIARYKSTVSGPLADKPLTQEVTSQGTIPAFDIDLGEVKCNGYIADTPGYVFDISSSLAQAFIFFESKQDATLLVAGPDGKVVCNDDSGETNSNPSVTLEKPAQGRYAVFVGRLSQDAPVQGTLTVTTDPKAVPAALPPSK